MDFVPVRGFLVKGKDVRYYQTLTHNYGTWGTPEGTVSSIRDALVGSAFAHARTKCMSLSLSLSLFDGTSTKILGESNT